MSGVDANAARCVAEDRRPAAAFNVANVLPDEQNGAERGAQAREVLATARREVPGILARSRKTASWKKR